MASKIKSLNKPVASSRPGIPAEKKYSFEDQLVFAGLSGDYNPLHTDPSAARRELFGDVVVHGIRVLLDGIELCAARTGGRRNSASLSRVRCMFQNPVYLNVPVVFKCDESAPASFHLEARSRSGVLLADAFVSFSPSKPPRSLPGVSAALPSAKTPAALSLEDIKNKTGRMKLSYNRRRAEALFPRLAKKAPQFQLSALLCLTRLVGMECPGLRSVLSSLDLGFDASVPAVPYLDYRVVAVNERFNKVDMEVAGPCLKGTVKTFLRPGPQKQMSFSEVGTLIDKMEFKDQTALIFGGTRGLGEITAKIIAAGGGCPVITYFSGAKDAGKIKAEIVSGGGRCTVLPFDVTNAGNYRSQLAALNLRSPAIYFFATPKIFVKKGSSFDAELFCGFNRFYVTGLHDTYALVRMLCQGPIAFFNPSSTAIDEKIPELMEYALSKKASEDLCAYLAAGDRQLKMVVKRLPRTATDQTATLTGVPAASAFEVMLPTVREIQRLL